MLVKCIICGKEIEDSKRGMPRKYCSAKCRADSRKEYLAEYYKQNYHEGSSFYNSRRASAKRYQESRRGVDRRKTLEALAKKLHGKSVEEMVELLESSVRSIKC